jgi:hypothetical protein
MLMYGDYQILWILVKGQSKWPIAKKKKLSFVMHLQLINMYLQEGMVIKDI